VGRPAVTIPRSPAGGVVGEGEARKTPAGLGFASNYYKASFPVPLLISCGTLQQEGVQLSTFGRLRQGERDELPGFEPSFVRIEGPQVVAASGKTHHCALL
jgi:hypothetical protein